jgi:hypothetical protein
VIFHVYGSHKDYESIIRLIRERTTADILLATDHITQDAQIGEETSAVRLWLRSLLFKVPGLVSTRAMDANWASWFNYDFLPTIAARYGAELADVRVEWKQYLSTNHLLAGHLLKDSVHLNEQGQFVMAEIIDTYLRPGDLSTTDTQDDRFVELVPKSTGNSSLVFNFQGSRIDAVIADGAEKDSKILIDGRAPCSLPELYGFNRTSTYPGSNWPALLQVEKGSTALVAEMWTAVVTNADRTLGHFKFSISGSVTGFDGAGDSTRKFVSTSGRIVIQPSDWNLAYGRQVIKTDIPADFEITWASGCHGTDIIGMSPHASGIGLPITLAQGLANTKHTVEVSGPAANNVRFLREYRPLGHRE